MYIPVKDWNMKKQHVKLKKADFKKIEIMLSKGSLKSREYKRATGLLALNNGQTYQEVSKLLGVTYQAVSSWAKKYKSEGLSFLKDKPRSGRPLEIDALQKAKITALACSEPPEGRNKWTLRLLADKIVELKYCDHISHNHVSLLLKKMNLSLT